MINPQIKKILQPLMENEPLSKWTTFKIGGPAKYFYVARTSADLLKAVKLAEKLKLDYFILGGGSNVLVSDRGFDGLVIKARNEEFVVADNADKKFKPPFPPAADPPRAEGEVKPWLKPGGGETLAKASKNFKVICGAGLTVGRLLGLAAKHGLGGLEFMAGIPGTVGGAAAGNSGAYGKGLGDFVAEVELYQDGEVKNLNHKQMKYSYRSSVVKEQGGCIIKVTLALPVGDGDEFIKKIIEIAKERRQKLPTQPSAGSIFKNIEMDKIEVDVERVAKALDVTSEEFQQAAKYKLPIGFIMDKLNLKGKQIGGAKVSELHGNSIINTGKATAEEVVMLISYIKEQVRVKLGIQLLEEIKYVGFD